MHSSFRALEDIKNNLSKGTRAPNHPRPVSRYDRISLLTEQEITRPILGRRYTKLFFGFQERIVSSEIASRLGNRNNWQLSESHLLHEK